MMILNFMSKLLGSITSNDFYILFFAMLTCFLLVIVIWANKRVDKEFGRWKREKHYSRLIYRCLTIGYTLFVTLISIFPLLGMFGTVTALLGLDLSGEAAVASARGGFFNALTSTTWGIIFAIIFKIVNAVISSSVENNINLVTELINSGRGITKQPEAPVKPVKR